MRGKSINGSDALDLILPIIFASTGAEVSWCQVLKAVELIALKHICIYNFSYIKHILIYTYIYQICFQE